MAQRPRFIAILPIVALAVALVILAYSLAIYYVPAYYAGVDENGYFVQARNLATTGSPAKITDDPLEFVGENMVEVRPGVFYAKYPLGYPLPLALAYRLGGPDAPFLVNPLMALLAVVGIFLLGRAMIAPWAGAVAAILLAVHPLLVYYGLRSMSHATDLAVVTWAMFFLWQWSRRGSWHFAVLAGLLAGYAVSVRYTEALLILPMSAMLLLRYRVPRASAAPRRGTLRTVLFAALLMTFGGLLGLLPQLIHQARAFGSPLATGYALSSESTSFSWAWFTAHVLPMLKALNLPGFGLPGIFLLALVGLFWLAYRRQYAPFWFLGLWAIPSLLLYAAYYWQPAESHILYTRLFLDVFPALILAALTVVAAAIERWPVVRIPLILGVLLLASVNFTARATGEKLDELYANCRLAQASADLILAHLPPGSALVAERSTAYFLDYRADFHLYYPLYFNPKWASERLSDQSAAGPVQLNPLRAHRMAAALGDLAAPHLAQVLRTALLRRAAEGRTVALLVPHDRVSAYRWLGDAFAFRLLGQNELEWDLYQLTPLAPAAAP